MKLILYLFTTLLLVQFPASAKEIDSYGATCKEIGFKPKTTAYGNCVLELHKRDSNTNSSSIVQSTSQTTLKSRVQGDGSDGDATCQKYGFEPQTQPYNQCRLQIDLAKKQFDSQQAQYEQQQMQYEEQKNVYDQQVAKQEAAKEERKNLKLMELGLRMYGGQSTRDAAMATAGMAPIMPQAPARPAFENYTITMPNGRTTNCTYATEFKSMTCN